MLPTQQAEAGVRQSRLQQTSGASGSHSSLRARFNLEAFKTGTGQSRRTSTGCAPGLPCTSSAVSGKAWWDDKQAVAACSLHRQACWSSEWCQGPPRVHDEHAGPAIMTTACTEAQPGALL